MDLSTLSGVAGASGLSLGNLIPSGWAIAALLIFGVVGLVGWSHGRRQKKPAPKWIGLALMLYPYLSSDTAVLWVVGVVLTLALAVFWDR